MRAAMQMEGYLKKKVSLIQGYKERWFYLQKDGHLKYFIEKPKDNPEVCKAKGQMSLLLSEITIKKDQLSFKVTSTSDETYSLRAHSLEEREKWVKAINDLRTDSYYKMYGPGEHTVEENDDETVDSEADQKGKEPSQTEESEEKKQILETNELSKATDKVLLDKKESPETKESQETKESPVTNESSGVVDDISDASTLDIASLPHKRTKPFVAVAAIDFGTTYSGCAFSTTQDFKTDPLKIQTVPLDEDNVVSYKTPTVLLLTPNGQFHAFGTKAEEAYQQLAEKDQAHEWYYFNKFKMQLYKNKELSRDMVLKDMSGKTMAARKVFAFCIEYIKDMVVERLSSAVMNLDEDDIHWVLTVPAIWNDQARQFMIEAAKTAGIEKQHLTLALEPEGAAMCCKYLAIEKQEHDNGSELKAFEEGAKFTVVDLGGGTIDITVSEVVQDGKLKEIYNATGGPWGGNYINDHIIKKLNEIIGWETMRKFQKDDLDEYLEFTRIVEKKKRSIKLKSTMDLKVPDKVIQTAQINEKYKEDVKLDKKTLSLSKNILEPIYGASINTLTKHVEVLLSKEETKGVSTIILVGGYAACDLVQRAFKEKFQEKYKILHPLSPDMIVLKGAVIIGHTTEAIVGRKAKYHYGLGLRSSLVNGRRVSISEDEKKSYFPLIKKGQDIKVGDIVTEYEICLKAKSEEAILEVYTTEEDEPRNEIDKENFTRLGCITVKLPKFKTESEITLRISYGETEFKVVAIEKHTGRCFVGVCRFL